MAAPEARVVRSGRSAQVPARELVPGDLVLLDPGSLVPADLRLTESVNLQLQEASLTGESTPVEKQRGVPAGGGHGAGRTMHDGVDGNDRHLRSGTGARHGDGPGHADRVSSPPCWRKRSTRRPPCRRSSPRWAGGWESRHWPSARWCSSWGSWKATTSL